MKKKDEFIIQVYMEDHATMLPIPFFQKFLMERLKENGKYSQTDYQFVKLSIFHDVEDEEGSDSMTIKCNLN